MRDFQINHGVLTYFEMTGYRNHKKTHYFWKPVGCDMRKPVWWLRFMGWVWKLFGYKPKY